MVYRGFFSYCHSYLLPCVFYCLQDSYLYACWEKKIKEKETTDIILPQAWKQQLCLFVFMRVIIFQCTVQCEYEAASPLSSASICCFVLREKSNDPSHLQREPSNRCTQPLFQTLQNHIKTHHHDLDQQKGLRSIQFYFWSDFDIYFHGVLTYLYFAINFLWLIVLCLIHFRFKFLLFVLFLYNLFLINNLQSNLQYCSSKKFFS